MSQPIENETALPLVLELPDPAATLERVGGKGASLARLVAAGLPVPPGFHVTTAAYRRFVSAHALQDAIQAIAARVTLNRAEAAELAAQEIASLFSRLPMPSEVAGAIRQAYSNLGRDLPVAVRSSATAEDLPGLSFAGQLETYLNLQGEAPVLDAVKRCWASLWTARAIDYRAKHSVPPQGLGIAVIVQVMVAADSAGILFTANPVTQARDQVVIEAAWGLGEAIVGGQVTPDTILVDKQTGRVLEQEIGDKDVMTVRTATGTRQEPVPAERRTQPVLTAAQAAELARVGMQIENLFGVPMDIEWARADGRVFIVQARPITTLDGGAA